MRIFRSVFAAVLLFMFTAAIGHALKEEGPNVGTIGTTLIIFLALLFFCFRATSLAPRGSSELPLGCYKVLSYTSETPGSRAIVVLSRFPDADDDYGEAKIFCVWLESVHNTDRLRQVGAELKLVRIKGGTQFVLVREPERPVSATTPASTSGKVGSLHGV